ncbi:MAG TPA: FISUMP domain-containing protein [Bacteroidales bacterium]|nr:FISUMP domain-containing protein [Bacteroidales bacterium]
MKNRKIFTTVFFVIFCFAHCYSQNYQISFTGTGASTSVESVKIENLTQCTEINISGNDILNLSSEVGIDELISEPFNLVLIYPNPSAGMCYIDFKAYSDEIISIRIYDLSGKTVLYSEQFVNQGDNTFKTDGLSNGIFLLKLDNKHFSYTAKIIIDQSDNKSSQVNIEKLSESRQEITETNSIKQKSTKAVINMQYNEGDLLKLTGKSGNYSTVYMLTPSQSQTVTFTFIPCTDDDGNNYSVVKIGDQWWMAENLNSGTYVPITIPQAAGTKFCMNINGVEDPSCPMGGLYEWNILMQETDPCNGSGAPPDDRCDNPIQGMCPDGWHIPSHYEWTTLARASGTDFGALEYNSTLGVGVDEGGNLKMSCTTMWWDPNEAATNSTGFSGIPGGDTWDGVFEDFGQSSYFWTSSATFNIYTYNPWVYALNYSVPFVGRSQYFIENGFSCRCIKD